MLLVAESVHVTSTEATPGWTGGITQLGVEGIGAAGMGEVATGAPPQLV